ncbi:hypothetical protein D7X33_38405, partial [Butyricicoccus sp. 1XD8-22]
MKYRGIELSDKVKLYNKDDRCDLINEMVKKSLDDFIDLLNSNNHRLLSEYINSTSKVLVDFNCNHKPHWISPAKYKLGRGCPKCANMIRNVNKSKKAKDDFISLVKSNGHTLLSDYTDASTKVLINYNCGHEPHLVIPNNYKKENGTRCPKCSGKSLIQAKENLINLVKENDHILLSEYVNAYTKVLIDFKCGHDPRWISPPKYKAGRGCWICSESKGEKKIRKWLENNKIKFESQKSFNGLLGMGDGNLTYDFFLPEQNLLIECRLSLYFLSKLSIFFKFLQIDIYTLP